VAPEEEGKAIKVDQIRHLVDFMNMTSQYGRYKIAIISPAEQMNINASNSLLKTLEEPTASSLLMLETAWPGMLPATVRSRCQRVQLHVPAMPMALDWLANEAGIRGEAQRLLALANGAPLLARELAASGLLEKRQQRLGQLQQLLDKRQDAVAVAGDWQQDDVSQLLDWLSGWVMELIRLKSTENQQLLHHPEEARDLQILSERLDLAVLFRYYDELTRARQLARTQVNKQLLLEGLLIQWSAGLVLPGDGII
jgi:DNA polymerase-3 subunit delta'